MAKDDREREGKRWSYCRDLGPTRLIVVDVAHGALPRGGRAQDRRRRGVGVGRGARHRGASSTTCCSAPRTPTCSLPAFHHLEAWSERVCDGALGRRWPQARRRSCAGARLRPLGGVPDVVRAADRADPRGRRGRARRAARHDRRALRRRPSRLPGGGRFPARRRGPQPVYQAVCSPYRNALDSRERRVIRVGRSRPAPRRSPAGSPRPPAWGTPGFAGASARARTSTTRWRP